MSVAVASQNPVHRAVESALEGFEEVKKDTGAFYQGLNFTYYGAMGLELATTGKTPGLIKMQSSTGISVIDAVEIVSVVDYWVNGKFLKDANWNGIFSLLGNICMGVATLVGLALYLAELGFYRLADVMVKIGSWLLNVGSALLVFVRVFATAGFALFCANAIKNAVIAKNDKERTKAIIDCTAMAFSAALQVLFMASAATWALVIFGLIAAGLGVASFLYGHFNKV